MYLMADAVAGAGVFQPVTARNALQIAVVIGIFKAALQRVVVNVRNGKFGFYPINAHGFKLQIRHRSGRVLCQRLIDADGNFFSGLHGSLNKVIPNQFLC